MRAVAMRAGEGGLFPALFSTAAMVSGEASMPVREFIALRIPGAANASG